jgi:hypothetical protein
MESEQHEMNVKKEKTKNIVQHDPIYFVNQYISHTWNSGALLSLSLATLGFSEFFKDRKNKNGMFFIIIIGLLLFVYNVFYTIKSIQDFKDYLLYYEQVKDSYDPIYFLYMPKWKKWITYQYCFLSIIILLGIVLLGWTSKRLWRKIT